MVVYYWQHASSFLSGTSGRGGNKLELPMASHVVNLRCNHTAKTLSWVAHPIFSLMRNLKKLLMDLVTRTNLVMVVLELFTKVGIMFAKIPSSSIITLQFASHCFFCINI